MEYFLSFLLLCKTCKTAFEKVVKVSMPSRPTQKPRTDGCDGMENEIRFMFDKGIEKLDFKCSCTNPYQVVFLGMKIIQRA